MSQNPLSGLSSLGNLSGLGGLLPSQFGTMGLIPALDPANFWKDPVKNMTSILPTGIFGMDSCNLSEEAYSGTGNQIQQSMLLTTLLLTLVALILQLLMKSGNGVGLPGLGNTSSLLSGFPGIGLPNK